MGGDCAYGSPLLNTEKFMLGKFLVLLCLAILLLESPVSARPLNPDRNASSFESPIDQYFRIALDAATGGDFDTAIINYQHAAAAAADSDCDRKHAEAGVEAAKQAKAVQRKLGARGLPTQGFWQELQRRTAPLRTASSRCVYIRTPEQ